MQSKRDNKIKGNLGESKACEFLVGAGFEIMSRNFSCKLGEVDIVARKGSVIHFVEVKSRTDDFISGRYAVNIAKQRHIKNTANFFLARNGLMDKCFVSFDVVELTADKIEFLENCFY